MTGIGICIDCGNKYERTNNSCKRCAHCKHEKKLATQRLVNNRMSERRAKKCKCGASMSHLSSMCKECRNAENRARACASYAAKKSGITVDELHDTEEMDVRLAKINAKADTVLAQHRIISAKEMKAHIVALGISSRPKIICGNFVI